MDGFYLKKLARQKETEAHMAGAEDFSVEQGRQAACKSFC